ncbi:glycosyltransferase [Streptomyces sp. NRRL S-350]|uniref:glycosyltransferase n=1 Tax=Streptomyces sp. NRRL S-350 TaxID=1463902 RepID=UPI0006893C1B|nr:glycosyltransferase [Streptomyces sp. NRRL S-350]
MTRSPGVAVLPSRNEPDTVATVTKAVDAALDDARALIVHADSSDTPATAAAFAATATRSRTLQLTDLPRGKGAQVLAALHRVRPDGPVLLADTDTHHPDPAVYRALLDAVRADAGLAIADYPRFWDEANLTVHLARPLIAATTGFDVPQPLAGDVALSATAADDVLGAAPSADRELADAVAGYGIDAFLLLASAARHTITSVRLDAPKLHAPSFPHLPTIFAQAVPVLLAYAPRHAPQPAPGPADYRVADRPLTGERLQQMLTALDSLGPTAARYDAHPWPHHVAASWQMVINGATPRTAAAYLWPHYLDRVRTWLTTARAAAPEQRARQLAIAHADLADHLATVTRSTR